MGEPDDLLIDVLLDVQALVLDFEKEIVVAEDVAEAAGGFAGALILMVLAAYGYNGMDQSTIAGAVGGMKALMSWIPSAFAFLGAAIMLLYPLDDVRMKQIAAELAARRAA